MQISTFVTNIAFISTSGLTEASLNKQIELIRNNWLNGTQDLYVGFVFGKYDLVLIFKHESSKVASGLLARSLTTLGDSGIASSAFHPIIFQARETGFPIATDAHEGYPVKALMFIQPSVNLKEFVDKCSKYMQEISSEFKPLEASLLINDSSYSAIVDISSESFENIWRFTIGLRNKIGKIINSSCTYFTVQWMKEDRATQSTIEHFTFISLVPEEFNFRLDSQDKGYWKILGPIPGYFDYILAGRAKTLAHIRLKILELRAKYSGIRKTSTLLTMNTGGGEH